MMIAVGRQWLESKRFYCCDCRQVPSQRSAMDCGEGGEFGGWSLLTWQHVSCFTSSVEESKRYSSSS
jgi:hypothetical protein